MDSLTFDSICNNNGLIILDSLPTGDLQTGRRLYSNVVDHTLAIGRNGYCTRYQVNSALSLHAHLMSVLAECRAGILKPILHFEGHGHPEKGLFIAGSNEYLSWAKLQDWIAQINHATRNNTAVVVAACHGFRLSDGLQFNNPCPFNFLVAPNEEMSAGSFEDTMSNFYKEVAGTGDLATALAQLPKDMQLLVAGEWFYSNLSSYLIHHHTHKSRQEMVEKSISNQMDREPHLNRAQRRFRVKEIRKRAKKHVHNPNGFSRNFANIFFHGAPPIEPDDFLAYVKANKELNG